MKYCYLVEFQNKKEIKNATKKFISIVKSKAGEISKKYIFSPHTTDFAVMFLPTEGLYADVVRQRGLMQEKFYKKQIYLMKNFLQKLKNI